MKLLLNGLFVLFSVFSLIGCSKVPAGHVGVKVYLLGGQKGVDHEVLGVGRYWVGINEELYLFPVFQQNYTWSRTGEGGVDESLTFQTREGMAVNVDVGISYSINAEKISTLFQKYRRGVNEITDVVIRNSVRDALNDVAATLTVEEAYSVKKAELFEQVKVIVQKDFAPFGIIIDNIYVIGTMRLPNNVVQALNAKIEATQRAQQRENELREAEAEARKKIALAEAEAKANQLLQKALTPEFIQYEAIKKWSGQLPHITGGGALPFINVKQ